MMADGHAASGGSFDAGRDNRGAFATGAGSEARNVEAGVYIETYFDLSGIRPRVDPIYYNIPSLPRHYQLRGPDLDRARSAVLRANAAVCILSSARAVGLQGMGGVGKTVLATALALDPELLSAFPGGIAWLTFGQHVSFLAKAAELAFALTGVGHSFATAAEARGMLGYYTRKLKLLVVLDDVWEPWAADPFIGLGTGCRVLITTRNARVLERAQADRYELGLLTLAAARGLLAEVTGMAPEALPTEADDIVRECGRLPLALAAVGALVRRGTFVWTDVLTALREADLSQLDTSWLPDSAQRSLAVTLRLSVDALTNEGRLCFLDCAVFREDAEVPETTLLRLWSARVPSERHAKLIAQELVDCSLISRDEKHCYRIHDLYLDYLRHAAAPLAERHKYLIERIVSDCQGSLSNCSDDGYGVQHVPWHLREAGEFMLLHSLLVDLVWLRRKLKIAGIDALIADFDLAIEDAEVSRIKIALIRSKKVLGWYSTKLEAQLCGRLAERDGPNIARLLAAARKTRPPILVPTHNGYFESPSLLLPAIPPTSPGDAFAVLPDGRRVLAGCDDETLRMWDLQTGGELQRFEGHNDWVRAVTVLPGGRRALSGSDDGTLCLWDLQSGIELRRYQGHTDWVRSVAVLSDCRHAISASYDRTLRIWDLETGAEQSRLEGHTGAVTAMTVLPDGRRALSGSWDSTLRLWDLHTGTELRRFKARGGWVSAVAMLADGRRALVGSYDGTLGLWDVEDGIQLRQLKGHANWISAIAVLADQRRVLSSSPDQTMRLWDLEIGAELTCFIGDASITAIAPSSVRNRVTIRDRDGRIMIFDVAK